MRANNSTGLRLSASNADIDATFESITTSGIAKVKDVHKVLWPLAVKSDIQDPRVTKFLEEAEACRVEAAAVQKVIEALKVSNDAEQEVRSVQGSDAPVEAQIGFIVRKRNMKLGEVVNKWGNVTKITFRNRVRELGVIAGDERIDHVFSLIDVDNGGTLDTEELKEGLKLLVDAAIDARADEAERRAVPSSLLSLAARAAWTRAGAAAGTGAGASSSSRSSSASRRSGGAGTGASASATAARSTAARYSSPAAVIQ